jgi:hypothetical protein
VLMAKKATPSYSYRINKEGSYDSVCLRCFATIATAKEVAELHTQGKEHICHPHSPILLREEHISVFYLGHDIGMSLDFVMMDAFPVNHFTDADAIWGKAEAPRSSRGAPRTQ